MPSACKIAGCLVFRLHKHRAVWILRQSSNSTDYTAIVPIVAALRWLYKDIVGNLADERIESYLWELRY